MLDGELTRAQKMAAFVELCHENTGKAAGHILVHELPAGNHTQKLSALPDFVNSAVVHLGGPDMQISTDIRQLLGSIPSTESGREIPVVETIYKAAEFLGYR